MKIQELNDKNLLSEIKKLALKERKIGLEILKFICEIERRKCYIDLGHSSLFVYLTNELCYSESDAYRRIVSAKLLKEFPVLEEKIESGKMSSTNLTIIATTLKKHEVNEPSKKLEIIEASENKSKRELQKSLLERFGSEDTPKEVSINIPEELIAKMDKLKALKNRTKILSTAELLQTLVDEALIKEAKKLEKDDAVILEPEQVKEQQSRSVPAKVKRLVWKRANGQCEWIDPKSKKVCGAHFFLQYDHILNLKANKKSLFVKKY